MRDPEINIKGMVSAHVLIASSIFIATLMPHFFVEKYSVYGTHLVWLYSVSGSVAIVNITIFWLLGISPPTKKISLSYKVSRAVRSCLHFILSCLFFHVLLVLYGAPLLESVLETFSLAVLLSCYTTLRCLCILGPNVQAWIRVFSRNGAMSIWDTSLQITTACALLGSWVGAFPIPWTGTDPGRPTHKISGFCFLNPPSAVELMTLVPECCVCVRASSTRVALMVRVAILTVKVWPISCSLGATFGFLMSLLVAPGWIFWHRKQLSYKVK